MFKQTLKKLSKWRPKVKVLLRDILILSIALIVVDFWQRRNLIDDGERVRISDLGLRNMDGDPAVIAQSNRSSILYFFAPWCSVCKVSVPSLNQLYAEKQVQVFLIALDFSDINEIREFIASNKVRVPVLLGNTAVRDQFHISAYPTIYFLNSEDKVAASKVGYAPEWFIRLKLLLI